MIDQFLLWGIIILFTSAVLQGVTGFGFSILALPLITLFISPKTVVPILLLYSVIINLAILYHARKTVSLKKIWLLILFGIIGMPLGTHLLVAIDGNILRVFIGVIILISGTLLLLGIKKPLKRKLRTLAPIGFISGILGGSISISGPPLIIFFVNQNTDKDQFRGNLALYFFILNLFTIPVYFLNNLFTTEVINYTISFLPGLLIGVIFGNLLSKKIGDDHFKKLILILLIILGILSIITGLK